MICCPNNMKLAQLLVCFLLALPLAARSWTDTTGRTIEADFLSADATHVTLMFKGKETKLPLSPGRLSSRAKGAYFKGIFQFPLDIHPKTVKLGGL
jgi:hypothetical protein